MTRLELDSDAARRASNWLAVRGDAFHHSSFGLANDLADWQLDPGTSVHHLVAAATELWRLAGFLRLVADTAERADGGFDATVLAQLLDVAGAGTDAVPVAACRPDWATATYSPPWGDLAETGDLELRSPWGPGGGSPRERARRLLVRALADTGDARQIRADEFEIVRLDTGRYVVVLPGVTDLRSLDLGWSDAHRSVRDLDRAAVASSRSSAVADNAYARLVWEGLRSAGVPAGAELLVVGHSFGADTALDLAADPGFNGPGGYRVTHVLAAAYHSAPQLPHVPDSTEVLVVQNHRDLAVIAEAVGDAHLTEATAARVDAVAHLAELDLVAAGGDLARAWGHDLGVVVDGVGFAVDHVTDVVRAGTTFGNPWATGKALADLVTLEPGVTEVRAGQVVDVFEGGGDGAGHHQRNYVAHLEAVDDPLVIGFFTSVATAGYTGAGTAVAVDVSVGG